MVEGLAFFGELYSKVLFRTFPLRARILFFPISHYSLAIIVVSVFSFLFSCTRYPAKDTHLVHGFIVPNSVLYFKAKWLNNLIPPYECLLVNFYIFVV